MSDDKNSIYTDGEQKTLNTTQKVRLDIINNMTANGVPTNSSDIRVLKEVLDGADDAVHKRVIAKIKHNDTATKGVVASQIVETLKQISSARAKHTNIQTEPSEVVIDVPVDIVPGELEVSPTKLELGDFIGEHEDTED